MEPDSQDSKKGILKKDIKQIDPTGKGCVTWDEENILETFHPPNKDYGHMKIAEPPTPFESASESENSSLSGQHQDGIDSDGSEKKINFVPNENVESEIYDKDSEAHQKFEQARKKHYDEFTKVQLARKLMEEDLKEMEDDE